MESYHLFKVHKDTLEKTPPTRAAYYIEGAADWTLTGGVILQGATAGSSPICSTDWSAATWAVTTTCSSRFRRCSWA